MHKVQVEHVYHHGHACFVLFFVHIFKLNVGPLLIYVIHDHHVIGDHDRDKLDINGWLFSKITPNR